MPVYEYRCEECSEVSSVFVRSFNAAPPSSCRHCGGQQLKKIFSTFAHLKSEATKLADLDPRYGKLVDRTMAKGPRESSPSHYLDKMVPFSAGPIYALLLL